MLGEMGILKTGEWELMDKCECWKGNLKNTVLLLRVKLLTEQGFINSGRRICREQSQSQESDII